MDDITPAAEWSPATPTTTPWWNRPRFLTWLTVVTFVALVAFHVWWWSQHGRPIAWVLLIATPILCFVPSGFLVKVSQRSWTTAWARAHGFDHEPKPAWPLPQWNFPPFSTSRARRKRLTNGMRGRVGRFPATYVHYSWWNNNRIQFSSHYRNVFVLELPSALPRLTIGPTTDMSVGGRVEFESADFAQKFSVASKDHRFAHAVITPRTINALVDLSRRSTAAAVTKFEIADEFLVGVSPLGSRPPQITEIFAAMHAIAEGIPDHIWADRSRAVTQEEKQ